MRSRTRIAVACCAMALLARCASDTPPAVEPREALLSACETWATTLSGLAGLRSADQLSASQIATVDRMIVIVHPICQSDPPADGADAAARLVEAAVREVTR